MTISYNPPREYVFNVASFNPDGSITERVRTGLENVLAAYVVVAKLQARATDDNPANYRIQQVSVVGSCARCNKIDSDLDLLLISPNIDPSSARQMKVFLAEIYFVNRPKIDAIDVFVRREDEYPDRASVDITSQAEDLIKKYNDKLNT